MKTVRIKDEFIKLGQLLKLVGLVDSGLDAKVVIMDGKVKVNGVTDTRRGKKVLPGDIVTFDGNEIKVSRNED